MPLHRRLPKRGFKNIFKVEYAVVSLERIAALGESNVSVETMRKAGLVKGRDLLVKVLGDGELKDAVNVQAHKFSKSAQDKISKAGGKAEVVKSEVGA